MLVCVKKCNNVLSFCVKKCKIILILRVKRCKNEKKVVK